MRREVDAKNIPRGSSVLEAIKRIVRSIETTPSSPLVAAVMEGRKHSRVISSQHPTSLSIQLFDVRLEKLDAEKERAELQKALITKFFDEKIDKLSSEKALVELERENLSKNV